MTIKARIKYHEQNLTEFKSHVEQGTFPKRLKSITIPKMRTVEGQNTVKKACHDLETVLGQTIQEIEAQLAENPVHERREEAYQAYITNAA